MARPAASPEQRDRQRNRIRAAAGEVHAERGTGGVTARAIAQRAGVSTGTLYSYFSSLGELMRSLWLEPVAIVNRELEETARAHPEPTDRIRALLTKYAAFARENPEVYRGALLFVRPESHDKPEPQPLAELPFHRLLCDALREGQLRGDFRRQEVDEQAQLLWAGLHGALGLSTNVDLYAIQSPEKLAPAMIEALLRAIEP